MEVFLKSRISKRFDKRLYGVEKCEESVAERKIYIAYVDGTNESYSMMQYIAYTLPI